MKFIKLTIISLFVLGYSAATEPFTINLITTNDLHGVLGEQSAGFMNPEYPPDILGMSAMYKYVVELREEADRQKEGMLILDGGNFFQGHPLGLADSGKTVIEWMNQVGYDALTPGAYDFITGAAALNRLAEMADFPFLGSNLSCNNCPITRGNIKPYIIKEVSGIRVGILGIVNSRLEYLASIENIPGINAGLEVPALRKWVPRMKKDGAEVIIVLASNGVPWDREEVYAEFIDSLNTGWNAAESSLNAVQMGYYAEGVDVIVSGGVSRGYRTPWYDPYSHVFIFQNYGGGTEFSHIRLLIDRDTHTFMGYESVIDGRISQTLLADDFTPDPQMHQWIADRVSVSLDELYRFDDWFDHPPAQKAVNVAAPVFTQDVWEIPSVNDPKLLEVITWNCEFFPANDDETIRMLSETVNDLDADLYAFQEIRYPGWFSRLMEKLPQYDYIISQQASFMDMAIVFKKDRFRFIRQLEPFADDDYNYAGRPPLRGDFFYLSDGRWIPLSVINLHMKCCDSGLIRRQKAVKMLYDYVNEEMEKGFDNFIILGDWNDDIKDDDIAHSFHPFMNDDRFYFPTWKITYDPLQASYPKEPYVSFLDHILVTRELMPEEASFSIRTLKIEDYVGGFDKYEENISDHRPVMLQFDPVSGN